jgi:hypothetical protein
MVAISIFSNNQRIAHNHNQVCPLLKNTITNFLPQSLQFLLLGPHRKAHALPVYI